MSQNSDPYQNPYDSSQQYPPQPPAQTDPYGSAGAPPPPLDPTQYAGQSPTTQGGGYPPPPSGPGYQPPSGPGYQPPSGPGYPGTNPPYAAGNQPPNYYQAATDQGYPGYVPPQAPKKKRTWLWVLLSIIAIIVIGCVSICAIAANAANQFIQHTQSTVTAEATSLANTSTGTTPVTSSDVTPTVDSSTASTPTSNTGSTADNGGVIAVGQAHTFASVSCTMTSAKILPGDQYSQPDAGQEFVEINVTIKNNSSVNYDYNEFDFYAISEGDTTQESFTYPQSVAFDSMLDSGTVDPGQQVTGNLVIEIHSGDHNAILKWQASYSSAVDYEWKLGV